jgi:hypothetical protein
MSIYTKVLEDENSATKKFLIAVADDPGADGLQPPSHQILCTGMYDWAADWLLGVLEGTDCPQGPN